MFPERLAHCRPLFEAVNSWRIVRGGQSMIREIVGKILRVDWLVSVQLDCQVGVHGVSQPTVGDNK